MFNEPKEVTREELKTNVLLERVAQLENDKADLRVELHVYASEIERLRKELETYVQADEQKKAAPDDD